MARTPRASVPKTSGQGVSRLAYQKGYRLRNSDAPKVGTKFEVSAKSGRNYAKDQGYEGDPKINVSYGDTLGAQEMLPERPPKAGVKNEIVKGKKLK
jgi:hypothetical protein